MELYDNNVTTVLSFLRTEKYSASIISMHKLCYKGLKDHLIELGEPYSLELAYQWLDDNKLIWGYRKHIGWWHCIAQLEDIYTQGYISLDNLGPRTSAYAMLSGTLRSELDDFLNVGLKNRKDNRYRISCSRFLLYLQNNGFDSICQIDYGCLFCFHNDDYHQSAASKDVYEDLIRVFLRYCAETGKCSIGFSLVLKKMILHKVIRIPDDELIKPKHSALSTIYWSLIERFLEELADIGYGKTVIKSAKHILTLLYIFLDMHHIQVYEEYIWLWFERVQPHLGTGWKQHRRSLCQFLHYVKTGSVVTAYTGDPAYIQSTDKLPDWASKSIHPYLDILRREGLQKSTITMHLSCCIRFCRYLQKLDLSGFSEITTSILQDLIFKTYIRLPKGRQHITAEYEPFSSTFMSKGLSVTLTFTKLFRLCRLQGHQ